MSQSIEHDPVSEALLCSDLHDLFIEQAPLAAICQNPEDLAHPASLYLSGRLPRGISIVASQALTEGLGETHVLRITGRVVLATCHGSVYDIRHNFAPPGGDMIALARMALQDTVWRDLSAIPSNAFSSERKKS